MKVRKGINRMLYIMRHGKTDWNEQHKLQGRTDIPLNENGIAMAKKAAEEYRDIHLDICYCSPLKRAEQTARIVLSGRKAQVPVVIDDRLIEMGFGEYEGVQNSFNISDCNVNVLFRNPDRYIADKGAESLDELFERTGQFLDEVIQPELAKGRDILIVGHGAMNSSIICQIRNKTYAHFWDEGIENCRLKRLI